MEKQEIRYRMFGFVPYNISEIQKGIQCLHGVVEYQLEFGKNKPYKEWAEKEKTIIILNGGTTGHNSTMLERVRELNDLRIPISTFHEPDLNDALTSVNFILPSTIYDLVLPEDFVRDSKRLTSEEFEIKHYVTKEQRVKLWLSKFKLA